MATATNPVTRRHIHFIKKGFQTRFIVRFCLIMLLFGLIIGNYLYWYGPDSTTIVFKNLRIQTVPTQEFLYPSITAGIVIALIIASIVTILLTLVVSHRIGGPIYRFEQVLKELEAGNLTQRVHLRDYDQIQEIGNDLNDTLGSLHRKVQAIDMAVDAMEKKIGPENTEVLAEIQKIKETLKQFHY